MLDSDKKERVFIIAEAGVNHNGSFEMAADMVRLAAEAGADAIKFQTFRAETLATQSAPKANYQLVATGQEESQFQMLKSLELSPKMHTQLIKLCSEQGIMFLSTPFDIESARYLSSLGLEILKIPSGEITNLPYLRVLGSLGRKIILSSGMAVLDEISAALDVLTNAGTPLKDITVLHATTAYPTPYEDANLSAMQTIRESLNVMVGYSDHTPGIEVSLAATALGASVIEKHFTLDRNLPGPDHKASLLPDELRSLIKGCRRIEAAMGDGIKQPQAAELANMDIARKSIVAARNIKKGEPFTEDNLTVKRPGNGISPMKWDSVLGRKAKKDFMADSLIEP